MFNPTRYYAKAVFGAAYTSNNNQVVTNVTVTDRHYCDNLSTTS